MKRIIVEVTDEQYKELEQLALDTGKRIDDLMREGVGTVAHLRYFVKDWGYKILLAQVNSRGKITSYNKVDLTW